MIKGQTLIYVFMLVIGAIFLPFQSKYGYREQLVIKYNEMETKENALYLNRLHRKFSCCGVTGQKFNITNDPSVWNPDDEVLRKLPKSCCSNLDANQQCTSNAVYQTTCDDAFQKAAHTYKTIVIILLSVSIVFTLITLFALKRMTVLLKT